MGGVGAQVHHDLMNLRGVGQHRRAVGRQLGADFDGGRQRRAQKFQGFRHDLLQMKLPAFLLALPAEGQNLRDEVLRAAAGFEDRGQRLLRGVLRRQVHAAQLGVHHNAREDVVEIMGDAAGQCADGFELVRLAQLRLEPLPDLFLLHAPRHVLHHAHEAHDFATGVQHRRSFATHHAFLAVRPEDPMIHLKRLVALDGVVENPPDSFMIFDGNQAENRGDLRHKRRRRDAENAVRFRRPMHGTTGRLQFPTAQVGDLLRAGEDGLALAQRRLGLLSLRAIRRLLQGPVHRRTQPRQVVFEHVVGRAVF